MNMTKEQISAIRRENLASLIDERFDGKQARLAAAIGKPANYVWRILTSGPHAKGIGEEIARLIEDKLGLSPYALDKSELGVAEHELSPAPSAVAQRAVHVVRGSAIESVHGKPTSGWVRRNAVAELFTGGDYSEDAFALPVQDTSMEPNFLPGEMLVFDPALAPEAGDYVLARVRGGVLFRRYRPSHGNDFMLDAMSEAFAPVWSDRDTITILGVLVEHHRTRAARHRTHN